MFVWEMNPSYRWGINYPLYPGAAETGWARDERACLFLNAIHLIDKTHEENAPRAPQRARSRARKKTLFSGKTKTSGDKGGGTLKGFLRARLRIP